ARNVPPEFRSDGSRPSFSYPVCSGGAPAYLSDGRGHGEKEVRNRRRQREGSYPTCWPSSDRRGRSIVSTRAPLFDGGVGRRRRQTLRSTSGAAKELFRADLAGRHRE